MEHIIKDDLEKLERERLVSFKTSSGRRVSFKAKRIILSGKLLKKLKWNI